MHNTSTLRFFTEFSIFSTTLPLLVFFFLIWDASLTMSPSCKMHERLWIDTGPLISLHRQLPHSGVEPTPMAATAATQIRGQEEGEQSAQATRGFSLWGGQDDCGLSPASSKQHLAHTWCFPKTLKSACKTGTTAGVEAWRVLFKTHHRWEEVFVCVCVFLLQIHHCCYYYTAYSYNSLTL